MFGRLFSFFQPKEEPFLFFYQFRKITWRSVFFLHCKVCDRILFQHVFDICLLLFENNMPFFPFFQYKHKLFGKHISIWQTVRCENLILSREQRDLPIDRKPVLITQPQCLIFRSIKFRDRPVLIVCPCLSFLLLDNNPCCPHFRLSFILFQCHKCTIFPHFQYPIRWIQTGRDSKCS